MAIAAPPQAAPRRRFTVGRAAPDERLAARVRAGDESAFEVIYDRYHGELLAFCRHMVGTREEAEDVLQHVMVAAHRQLASGPETVALRPWLYAVARNRCVSVLRARRESTSLEAVAEPTAEGLAVAARVEQREDLQAMLGDLARLPDEQRAALLLSELGALSHDEIAEALGVRREKVKALVFQAREALSGWRAARDADCAHVREELSVARGGVLRRGPLRKHLEVCEGCRAFNSEVKRQRAAMAMLLPVLPTVALKANVLGAVMAGGSAAVSTGIGTVAAGGGAAAATSAGGVATGLTAKAVSVAALVAAAGGGYAVVDTVTGGQADHAPLLRQAGVPNGSAAAQSAGRQNVVILPAGAVTGPKRSAGNALVVVVEGSQLSATWAPATLVPPTAVLTLAPTATATDGQVVAGIEDAAATPGSNGKLHGRPDPPARGVNGTAPGQTKTGTSAADQVSKGRGPSATGNAGGNGGSSGNGNDNGNSSTGAKGQGSGSSTKSSSGNSSTSGGSTTDGAGGSSQGKGDQPTKSKAGGTSSGGGSTNSNAGGNSDTAGTPPANSNAGGNGDTAEAPPVDGKAGGGGGTQKLKAGDITVITGD